MWLNNPTDKGVRGDQLEVFTILNYYENIDRNILFSLKKDSKTRGHVLVLKEDV